MALIRNSEETKRRLLDAATAEFAAFGIAGARIDNVAEMAGCNKQSIYRYFESKEGLFDAVFNAMVVQTVSSVPADGFDLPGYAGALFDWYRAHPEVLRLATWQQLERPRAGAASEASAEASIAKLATIRAAQAAGVVTTALTAEQLLVLVLRLSTAQLDVAQFNAAQGDDAQAVSMRAALIEAVRRLAAP